MNRVLDMIDELIELFIPGASKYKPQIVFVVGALFYLLAIIEVRHHFVYIDPAWSKVIGLALLGGGWVGHSSTSLSHIELTQTPIKLQETDSGNNVH